MRLIYILTKILLDDCLNLILKPNTDDNSRLNYRFLNNIFLSKILYL